MLAHSITNHGLNLSMAFLATRPTNINQLGLYKLQLHRQNLFLFLIPLRLSVVKKLYKRRGF